MTHRSAGYIQRWLDTNLHRFDLPSQMLGDEPNARRKNWDDTVARWCMVASWPYEQAAGNSSIPAVYCCVNDAREDFLCDRFYLPNTPRDLRLLERAGIPVFGIESKHQLRDFDVVGTSISYPVLSMSFVKMLKISDIPIRWRDREAGLHPMVIAGGLAYGAPEVLAPVVDCWWLGEVEDEPDNPGIAAVTARIAAWKQNGRWLADRLGCYADLAREFRFLYFPRFVDVHYRSQRRPGMDGADQPSKQVVSYTSRLDGMRLPFLKRHVRDLDAVAPLAAPPLLYADPAMGSGDLEVGRGCPAWCSFCALTYRQKPYRQRTVRYVTDYAQDFADNMGSLRMAPFSPDFPMHTQRNKLIAALLEKVSDEVDAPTMRVDDFIADDKFILLQVHGGMDTVTLGVEGNSQRMRDFVGKGTADADILEAVTRGIHAGIRKFKLYMISNLPGENEGDLFRILKLARDIADIREQLNQPTVRVQFSWTPLLIEGNTPMQWFAPTLQNRLLGDVWESLRDLKIDFKVGSKGEINKMSFFQLCQRASRDVGEALVDVMDDLDQACWGGVPRDMRERLDDALRTHGFTNGFADCFDERDRRDMFGWEMIDQGISTALMWSTYVQMREFLLNTDAHTYDTTTPAGYHGSEWVNRCDVQCQGKRCGACTHADLKIRTGYMRAAQSERRVDLSTLNVVDQRSQALRVRARLIKAASHRYVDNSHWRFAVRRAAFRSVRNLGLPFTVAKRSIRFASDSLAARDWSWGVDYVEFGITRAAEPDTIDLFCKKLDSELGPHLDVVDWRTYPVTGTTLRTAVDSALYTLPLPDEAARALEHLDRWNAAEHIPVKVKVDGGYFGPTTETVDARAQVDELWLTNTAGGLHLNMHIVGRLSPYHVAAAFSGKPSWLDLADQPARRHEVFAPADRHQDDALRPNCGGCGWQIPTDLFDRPYAEMSCPRCLDATSGRLVERQHDR